MAKTSNNGKCAQCVPEALSGVKDEIIAYCDRVASGETSSLLAHCIPEIQSLFHALYEPTQSASRGGKGLAFTCPECGEKSRWTIDKYRQAAPHYMERLIGSVLYARSQRRWMGADVLGFSVDLAPEGDRDSDLLVEVKVVGVPDLNTPAKNRRRAAGDTKQRAEERRGWAYLMVDLDEDRYGDEIVTAAGIADKADRVGYLEKARVACSSPRLSLLVIARVVDAKDLRSTVAALQCQNAYKHVGLLAWTITDAGQVVWIGPGGDMPRSLDADTVIDLLAGSCAAKELPAVAPPCGWQAALDLFATEPS